MYSDHAAAVATSLRASGACLLLCHAASLAFCGVVGAVLERPDAARTGWACGSPRACLCAAALIRAALASPDV